VSFEDLRLLQTLFSSIVFFSEHSEKGDCFAFHKRLKLSLYPHSRSHVDLLLRPLQTASATMAARRRSSSSSAGIVAAAFVAAIGIVVFATLASAGCPFLEMQGEFDYTVAFLRFFARALRFS